MAKRRENVRRRVRRRRNNVSLFANMSAYQQLLHNPCASSLVSPYGGEAGIVQRFTGDVSIGNATGTCGLIALYPNLNAYGGFAAAASNVATAVTTSPAVASSFMGSSVQKARVVAACCELIPSALSYNNITGDLAVGVIGSDVIAGGASYTVDAIYALLSERDVLEKKSYEVKWFPGTQDDLYGRLSGGSSLITSATGGSGQNCIVIAWKGIPATTLINFRFTIVYEWVPQVAVGVATSAAPQMAQPWQNESAALHSYNPSWWTGFAHAVAGFSSNVRQAASMDATIRPIYQYLQPINAARTAVNAMRRLL